ncbi:dTDP-4-amino-4,6-dideoxygalactose transaminase [Bacteroidota bacterium]
MKQIPFNKPYLTGNETKYIEQAVASGKISGNGMFTQKCQTFFEERYGIQKALLTTSCTDALEMCAILLNIKEGDEVIMPSYTFVSTANAFVLRGAKIVFADSRPDQPNIDENGIEALITSKTKAIVVVHYAGVACEMDTIMALAKKHHIYVVEDAAQAIDSYYKGKALGSIGHLSVFSFHETKNIISGEGGLLGINDENFIERAEIIWEKGTNRSAFFRGEVDKYGWVDVGSSFLPSEVIAAFLWAQLENLENIQARRKVIWNAYYDYFVNQSKIQTPFIPKYATNNAHMFYVLCKNLEDRNKFIKDYKEKGIHPVFHYVSLHSSPFYKDKHDGRTLSNCDRYAETLVRMPLFYELDVDSIVKNQNKL